VGTPSVSLGSRLICRMVPSKKVWTAVAADENAAADEAETTAAGETEMRCD